MIKKYIENRQIQNDTSKSGDSYTTMRSLLALIRLAQARVIIHWYRLDLDSLKKLQCLMS